MKRRRFLVLSAGCMMGLLSACGLPMSENVQVEELLRAPRLPGDYGALQNALNEWLGESALLKYPMQGELLSPFLLQDLDGDGQQDAAVLYTTAQSSNVCIAFLQKDAAGVWQVRQSIEGLADTVDNVRLAQLQDGAATQLVVPRRATAIWRCTPTRTARSMPFWNSPMSSIWWRISPAAATRI